MDELAWPAPETRAALHYLQCLDDALAYRTSRLARPCPACAPGGRCEDHRRDEDVIAGYRDRSATVLRDFLSRFDPGDVQAVTSGPESPPPAEQACAVAMITWLRQAAADGPVLTERAGRPVIIEMADGQLIEHPLPPGSGTPEPPG